MPSNPGTGREFPPEALAALRRGETVAAIRLVRTATGLGLKEAKGRVDAALAADPALAEANIAPVRVAVLDYLANAAKFPLASGFIVAFLSFWLTGTFFPDAGKDLDPGIRILGFMGLPFVIAMVGGMVWQRHWRAARAAAIAIAAVGSPVGPVRSRFAGLPDPGADSISGSVGIARSGFSPAVRAALDRGDAIAAIKVLRVERGLGLAEAKALVDEALAERGR